LYWEVKAFFTAGLMIERFVWYLFPDFTSNKQNGINTGFYESFDTRRVYDGAAGPGLAWLQPATHEPPASATCG
jgi:hypothetical protein